MGAEKIIRIARIPATAHPLPIWLSDQPIPAEWVAISLVRPEFPGRPPSYVLYFIDCAGEILEFLSWESMRIALDQARHLARVDESGWSSCEIDVPLDGPIDTALFLKYHAG